MTKKEKIKLKEIIALLEIDGKNTKSLVKHKIQEMLK